MFTVQLRQVILNLIRQVILNLIMNEIEAMRGSQQRELQVASEGDGRRNVLVSVAMEPSETTSPADNGPDTGPAA